LPPVVLRRVLGDKRGWGVGGVPRRLKAVTAEEAGLKDIKSPETKNSSIGLSRVHGVRRNQFCLFMSFGEGRSTCVICVFPHRTQVLGCGGESINWNMVTGECCRCLAFWTDGSTACCAHNTHTVR
ncbi:unnamed protein product, partial [Ectocarpus fasciculatus]